MGTMTSLLPSRWKDYLAAWNSIITLTPFAKKNWNDIALRPPRSAISPITTKHFLGPDHERVSANIGKDSVRTLLKKFRLIIPPGWADRFPGITPNEWEAWWRKLKRISSHSPEDVDLSHRLSLYSLHPGSQVGKNPTHQFINNRSTACILCLDLTSQEDFQHLLVDCTIARRIWTLSSPQHLPPPPHPNLQTFVCPSPIPRLPHLIQNIVFLGRIWKFSRSRRWGKKDTAVVEVTDEEVDKVAKAIRRGTARVDFRNGRMGRTALTGGVG